MDKVLKARKSSISTDRGDIHVSANQTSTAMVIQVWVEDRLYVRQTVKGEAMRTFVAMVNAAASQVADKEQGQP